VEGAGDVLRVPFPAPGEGLVEIGQGPAVFFQKGFAPIPVDMTGEVIILFPTSGSLRGEIIFTKSLRPGKNTPR
jgi:hypothetical protein